MALLWKNLGCSDQSKPAFKAHVLAAKTCGRSPGTQAAVHPTVAASFTSLQWSSGMIVGGRRRDGGQMPCEEGGSAPEHPPPIPRRDPDSPPSSFRLAVHLSSADANPTVAGTHGTEEVLSYCPGSVRPLNPSPPPSTSSVLPPSSTLLIITVPSRLPAL